MADISKIQVESGTYDIKDEIARNGLNIIPEYIRNVKEYGAYGDGIHDDTTAIQNAIIDNDNNTIYIPSGTYLISEPIKTFITNSKKCNIKLEQNAIIKTNVALECLFYLGGLEGFDPNVTDRMRFFEGGTLDATNCNYAIKIQYEAQGITIRNCEIKNFNRYGIYAPTGSYTHSTDLHVANCYINGRGSHLDNVGIYLERPDNELVNLRINSCKKAIYTSQGGLYVDGVHGLGIGEGNWFDDTIFLEITGGTGNIITNSYCDTLQTFVKDYSNDHSGIFTVTNSIYFSYISDVETKMFIINNSGTRYIIKNNMFMLPNTNSSHKGIIYNAINQQQSFNANNFILEDNIINSSQYLINGDLLLSTNKDYKPYWSRLDLNLSTTQWLKLGYVISNTYIWNKLSININGLIFDVTLNAERSGSNNYFGYHTNYKTDDNKSIKIGTKYVGNINGIDIYGLYIKAVSTDLPVNIEIKNNNNNIPFIKIKDELLDVNYETLTMDNEATI